MSAFRNVRFAWTVLSLLVAAILLPGFCMAEEPAPGRKRVIKQIDIVANRVDPSVIRKALAFKEGEELTDRKVEESRKNLHELSLFRSLDVESHWDETIGGERVTVKAEDGWFLLPMPMFGSRGGETFAALMLMERNYFKKSEGIMAFGSYSEGRSSAMASLFLPNFFVMGGFQSLKMDEYQYADGGYNSRPFDDSLTGDEPEDFGTITNRYEKDFDKANIAMGGRITPWLRASAGLNVSTVSYDEAQIADPGDSGDFVAWTASLTLGKQRRLDPAAQGGFFGAFGRVFGLGMAGVKDSLKPLPKIETARSLELGIERGEEWMGSDSDFTKSLLTASQATLFRNRSLFTVALKGGVGNDLPPSQELSTGQRGLLTGVYAREFRGDSLAAATAVYSKPFFRNIIGALNAEIFGDYAVCQAEDSTGEKEGAGFNLVYRFWRFPLPIGAGATYSFDDRNWQASFAFGGTF
jgi:hypothetical protein